MVDVLVHVGPNREAPEHLWPFDQCGDLCHLAGSPVGPDYEVSVHRLAPVDLEAVEAGVRPDRVSGAAVYGYRPGTERSVASAASNTVRVTTRPRPG